MILEIESVYGDATILGKPIQLNKLQIAIKELLESVGEHEFLSAFCVKFGYEQISSTDDIKVDYIIDLDTHSVIKPKY